MGGSESKHKHTSHTATNTPSPELSPKQIEIPTLQTQIPSLILNDEENVKWFSEALPGSGYRKKWRMLYNSQAHGKSFNRFCHHVTGEGPTLIFIRDTKGAWFGGFAADMWKDKFPKYYGSPLSFVFTISPKKAIYHATTYNDHYQYLNKGTETLFNGVGMGGQTEFFTWCIASDFDTGQCRGEPSSTFGCPILSSTPDWEVDYVEVWEVKEPEDTYERDKIQKQKQKTKSVLEDDDNADKVITGLLGHNFTGHDDHKKDDENPQHDTTNTTTTNTINTTTTTNTANT